MFRFLLRTVREARGFRRHGAPLPSCMMPAIPHLSNSAIARPTATFDPEIASFSEQTSVHIYRKMSSKTDLAVRSYERSSSVRSGSPYAIPFAGTAHGGRTGDVRRVHTAAFPARCGISKVNAPVGPVRIPCGFCGQRVTFNSDGRNPLAWASIFSYVDTQRGGSNQNWG